jgi:hypothetical protein
MVEARAIPSSPPLPAQPIYFFTPHAPSLGNNPEAKTG